MIGLDWWKLAQKFSKGNVVDHRSICPPPSIIFEIVLPKSPMETSNGKKFRTDALIQVSYSAHIVPLQTGRDTILLNIKKRSLLAVNLMMFFLWFHIQNT